MIQSLSHHDGAEVYVVVVEVSTVSELWEVAFDNRHPGDKENQNTLLLISRDYRNSRHDAVIYPHPFDLLTLGMHRNQIY